MLYVDIPSRTAVGRETSRTTPYPSLSPFATSNYPLAPKTAIPTVFRRCVSAPDLQRQSGCRGPASGHRRRHSAPYDIQLRSLSHVPPPPTVLRGIPPVLEELAESKPDPNKDDIVVSLRVGSYNKGTVFPSPFSVPRSRQVVRLLKIPGQWDYRFKEPKLPPPTRDPGPGCTIYAYVPPASVVGAAVLDSGHLKRLITHFLPLDKDLAAYEAEYVRHAPWDRDEEFLRLEMRAKHLQSARHYARFVAELMRYFVNHLVSASAAPRMTLAQRNEFKATTLAYRRVLSRAVDTQYANFRAFHKFCPPGPLDSRRKHIAYLISLIRTEAHRICRPCDPSLDAVVIVVK